jgi:hypothetical protein
MHKKIKGILDLCRVSNLPTVISNCLASWLVAGGSFDELNLAALVSGAVLLYSGVMIMNDLFDLSFDGQFRPSRPIPAGIISKSAAGIYTLFFMVAGAALMVIGNAKFPLVLSLVTVIVAYNVFHKKWIHSVYIMGACRSVLYLACASAVTGQLSHVVIAWCICLGLYTAGITVVARGESTDNAVKLYGLVLLFSPALVPLCLGSGEFHLFGLLVVGSLWLAWTIYCLFIIRGAGENRIGRAVSYLIGGMVLIDGLAVSYQFGLCGLFFVPLLPLVLWFQTKVAGT